MLNKFITLTVGATLLASCSGGKTTTQTKLQYMPDMADAPTVKAQSSYINPPDHSVATNAILYPETAEQSAELLQNPYAGADQAKIVEEGKVMYDTYCAVCHGADASGKGNITDKFPTPPDLRTDHYKKLADGFFFHRITFGSAIMPSYGHAISPNERWQIVLYLRTLQKAEK